MGIRCGFFNSINHDRKYPASDMSEMFNGLFSDGIFQDAIIQDGYATNDKFVVTADDGFHLLVGTGKAWFNKIWIVNDSITGVEIGEPHLILPRIDAVALQIDKSDNARNVKIVVIPGIPAANPLKPTMRIDTEAKFYQYALAYVTVQVNVTAIEQADIENVVGSTETPYALYLGQSAVNLQIANNLTIEEPGWILDARQGKVLGDRIPFRFGMNANGDYGYYKIDGTFIPFMGADRIIKIGQNITTNGYTIDLKEYEDYHQFNMDSFFYRVNSTTFNINRKLWSDSEPKSYIEGTSVYCGMELYKKTSTINPSLTYDSNNGILTVNNLSKTDSFKLVIDVSANGPFEMYFDENIPFTYGMSVDIYLVH